MDAHGESGLTPGGDAYTGGDGPDGETGLVRDDAPPDNPPSDQIDEQSQTVERQRKRQSR